MRQLEKSVPLTVSNPVQNILDIPPEKSKEFSEEILNQRKKQQWQHPQKFPENILNNNLTYSYNNNNVEDDYTAPPLPSSSYLIDGDYQSMSSSEESDDNSSSSEDECSLSFSDTSPILDVSSLDSSDVSLDSDMSEDSSSPSPIPTPSPTPEVFTSSNNNNNNNNNNAEDIHALQPSWMPITETSNYLQSPSSSVIFHRRKSSQRNHVILPDVLPVSDVPRGDDDDEMLNERRYRSDYNLENSETVSIPQNISRECCIVEITTQNDIQVDIRLSPASKLTFPNIHPTKDSAYNRDISKNFNHCLKTKDVNTWTAEDKYQLRFNPAERKASPKCWSLGNGIRLNNFTITNGFRALSLTELVKSNGVIPNKDSLGDSLKVEAYIPTEKSPLENDVLCGKYMNNGDISAAGSMSYRERRYSTDSVVMQQNRQKMQFCNNPVIKKKTFEDKTKSSSIIPTQQNKISYLNDAVYVPQTRNSSKQLQDRNAQQNGDHETDKQEKEHNLNQFPQPKNFSQTADTEIKRGTTKMKSSESKLTSPELFEVYNMETTVPYINWAAVNRANKESEWIRKRRNDREEIRRKLAMDSDTEDYASEKFVPNQERKVVERIKGSSNLQICFMNEGASDQELPKEVVNSPVQEEPKCWNSSPRKAKPYVQSRPRSQNCERISCSSNNNNLHSMVAKRQRPTFFFNRPRSWHVTKPEDRYDPEEDMYARHKRLQTEAREALAQAKEMAKMQMEIERQKKKKSPIADIVGIPFPDGRNHLNRHSLLDMNVAQLQVIVNDLHSQIETLNEDLVKLLLERDDLHMEQDSMLVDIEDFTRYLGLKGAASVTCSSNSQLPIKTSITTNGDTKSESVMRSQSVHLKKSKNIMWPLPRLSLFVRGCN